MIDLTAKTFQGLEGVLAKELKGIGATDIRVNRRVVYFKGTLETIYRANYEVSTAINILVPIKDFKAQNEDELYEGVKSIKWEKYLQPHQTFLVQFTVRSENFGHSQYSALKTKDAIADYFREKFGKRPSVDKVNPDLSVDLNIRNDKVIISLNSTGQSLFKRGYRTITGEAPLNEVLAAGMIRLSGWDGTTDFYDPMCGSGTICIEAAMFAGKMPAGYYRKHYSCKRWADFDERLWDKVVENANAKIKKHIPRVVGIDSNFGMIRKARENASMIRELLDISFQADNMKDIFNPEPGTMIIFNPPYGERLSGMDGIKDYAELGDIMKAKFKGCTVWIITSDLQAIKHIGLKTSERISLRNGKLDCSYRKYEMR